MTKIVYPVAEKTPGTRSFGARRFPDPFGWLSEQADPKTKAWLEAQDRLINSTIRTAPFYGEAKAHLSSFPAGVPIQRVDAVEASLFMPAPFGDREFFVRRDRDGQRTAFVRRSGETEPTALRVPAGARDLFPSPSGRYVAYIDGVNGSVGIVDLDDADAAAVVIGEIAATHVCWSSDEQVVAINNFTPPSAATRPTDRSGVHIFDRHGYEIARIPSGASSALPTVLVPLWVEPDRLWIGIQDYWSQEVRGLFCVDPKRASQRATLIAYGRHALTPVGLAGERAILLAANSRGFANVISVSPSQGERTLATITDAVPVRFIPGKVWGRMAAIVGNRLYVACFAQTAGKVRVFDLDGADLGALPLPEGSGVDGLFPCPDGRTLRVAVQSYLEPPATLEFEGSAPHGVVHRPVPLSPAIARMAASYEQVSLFCRASDGAKIPITLVKPKGCSTRDLPLLLYVYGGFGNIWQPAFSAEVCCWLANGGTYAHAHIRGDGTNGKAWHEAAAPNREVGIADIAAVRDFLIAERHTSPAKIVLKGDSNGGLMVLAAMARHPDKFAGIIAAMPLCDPIAHLFERPYPTLINDFGDPAKTPADFERLLRWAPTYNISSGASYAPVLVTLGDQDTVVRPEDAYRLVAQLQALPQGHPLALLSVIKGHGHQHWFGEAGISASAEMLAFAKRVTAQDAAVPKHLSRSA